jgi:hypothetical protein
VHRCVILSVAVLAASSAARAQHPWRHYADAFEVRFAVTQPVVRYIVHVDSADLSGWDVALHLRNLPDTFRLAMAAHPEYDDRYWRYVTDVRIDAPGAASIVREDSAVWRVVAHAQPAVVRYRLALPPPEGPHSFLYVLGAELAPAHVTLDIPAHWQIATGLVPTADARTFFAPSAVPTCCP